MMTSSSGFASSAPGISASTLSPSSCSPVSSVSTFRLWTNWNVASQQVLQPPVVLVRDYHERHVYQVLLRYPK